MYVDDTRLGGKKQNIDPSSTKKHSNYTKFQLHVLMTTNARKKNLNQWENYLKYAHKLYWNAFTAQELVDLTFYGQ